MVFANSGRLPSAQSKNTPGRSQTVAATARRAAVSDIAKLWNARTKAQKDAWTAAASQSRSGYQQFLVCATARKLLGVGVVLVAGAAAVYPASKTFRASWTPGPNPFVTIQQTAGNVSNAVMTIRYRPLGGHFTTISKPATRVRASFVNGGTSYAITSLHGMRALQLEATLQPDRGPGDVLRASCIIWDDGTLVQVHGGQVLTHWEPI